MKKEYIYSPEYLARIERALCIIYANSYRNQQIVMLNAQLTYSHRNIIHDRIVNLNRQFNNWPMKELCEKHGIKI